MIHYFKIDSKKTEELIHSPLPPRKKKNYHEICWIQKGTVNFIVDGDLFEVQSNSVFAVPQNRYHHFLPKTAIVGHVIRFSEDFLEELPRTLFCKFNNLPEMQLTKGMNDSLKKLFFLIQKEYDTTKNMTILRHLIMALLNIIEEFKKNQLPTIMSHQCDKDLFDQFQNLLDKNILKNRTVVFYANLLNITPKKLNEITKSSLQETTESVIAKRLLIEAKRQLIYSNKNISSIAYDIGFKDNSYFTKFFKKFTNTTPKKYRSLHLKLI